MAKIQLSDLTFSEAAAITAGGHITADAFLPILSELDELGLASVEAFSPASFQKSVTTAFEDPWERLRRMRNTLKKTPLRISIGGQNICGDRNFPDDTVEYFIQKAADNGVDIIRTYDPLNDTRNMETALRTASLLSKKLIAGVVYTGRETSRNEVFTLYAKQLEEMGASAIEILDPAGILRPYDAYQLVKALRAGLSPETQLHLHTYCRTGMGQMTAMKAAEAGLDVIDTVLSPFALGSSLPSLETMAETFDSTPYATELPTEALRKLSLAAGHLYASLKNSHVLSSETDEIYVGNLEAMIPSALTAELTLMMRDARIQNRLPELSAEIARIRTEVGSIPLLSPVAEIVLAQAIFNLISEERYDTLTREFRALVNGEYGRTPSDIAPAFHNRICGTPNGITYRPADRMEPLIERIRPEIASYMETEEDVLTYAMLGKKAKEFFEIRKIQKYKLDADADFVNKIHSV